MLQHQQHSARVVQRSSAERSMPLGRGWAVGGTHLFFRVEKANSATRPTFPLRVLRVWYPRSAYCIKHRLPTCFGGGENQPQRTCRDRRFRPCRGRFTSIFGEHISGLAERRRADDKSGLEAACPGIASDRVGVPSRDAPQGTGYSPCEWRSRSSRETKAVLPVSHCTEPPAQLA